MEENNRSKRKKIFKELNEIKTLGELIDYIPMKIIQSIAFILLFIWSVSLVITMIYGSRGVLIDTEDWVSKLNQLYITTISWYRVLQQVGFLGCGLAILTLIKSIRDNKKDRIDKSIYLKERIVPLFLFLMLIWSVLSFLFSDNKTEGLVGEGFRKDGILTYIAVAGIFFCGYIIRNKRYVKWIIEINTIMALVQSILILINNESVNKFFALSEGSGIFLNINHAGYYLAMTAMCAILLIVSEENSKIKLVFRYAVFSIIIAALVKNSSFGPYLATLCAIISVIILTIWLKKISLRRIVIIVILFILVTFIMNIGSGMLYLDLRIFGIELDMIFRGEEDLSGVGSYRGVLWADAMKIIADNPILGTGPGNVSNRYFELTGESNKPHNEFLEYAVTLGIPGLLFYVMALFMYLKEFFIKRKNASLLTMGLLCVTIAYLVSSLVGVIMYHTLAFFFMFLGLSIGQLSQTKKALKENEEA